jgi:hypothetical protein
MNKGAEDSEERSGEEANIEKKEETETIMMTETLGTNEKATVGEELFLVHLSRHKGEGPREDDLDIENPRKRSRSVGEELWEVHLKRTEGLEPDVETVDSKPLEAPVVKSKAPKPKRTPAKTEKLKQTAGCSITGTDSVYHLRNRDVLIK